MASVLISIHVLREEDDMAAYDFLAAYIAISIHVLREEDDIRRPLEISCSAVFLSTSSARRTTR